MSADESTQTYANDSATSSPIDTKLAQGRSLGVLIDNYLTDPISGFQHLRYQTKRNHTNLLRRLKAQHGDRLLSDLRHRDFKLWHIEWSADGKLSTAHSFMAQLRVLCGYGAGDLEDEACERLCGVLHRLKFASPPPRKSYLTAAQANAVRSIAHDMGWPSIALAQAIQFECILRQGDCIGSWVPLKEPGESDVQFRGMKWLRGLRWNEIDDNLILRHVTSKKQKPIEIDLQLSPMFMAELPHVIYREPNGPVVVNEITAMPWSASEYRRKWRICADLAGVPKDVWNMDSRSGGISEADLAGVPEEHIQRAATHSDAATTRRYIRGSQVNKIANVQRGRIEYRLEQAAKETSQ